MDQRQTPLCFFAPFHCSSIQKTVLLFLLLLLAFLFLLLFLFLQFICMFIQGLWSLAGRVLLRSFLQPMEKFLFDSGKSLGELAGRVLLRTSRSYVRAFFAQFEDSFGKFLNGDFLKFWVVYGPPDCQKRRFNNAVSVLKPVCSTKKKKKIQKKRKKKQANKTKNDKKKTFFVDKIPLLPATVKFCVVRQIG
jgi:hypothetical protein